MRPTLDGTDTDELYSKLLESSFRFLSFRPRSEKEVLNFLQKKLSRLKRPPLAVYPERSEGQVVALSNVHSDVLHRVTHRLRDLGYLDDAKFASWWIDQRQSHKPKGSRLIALELKAKGVSDDLVKSFLVKRRDRFTCGRNFIDTDSESALAKRAVEKKLPLWQKLPKLEQKKKIYGFLGRRGFDAETIHRVIRDWDV